MVDLIFVLSVVLSVVLGGLGLLWVRHLSVSWQKRGKSGSRLPEGSLGVPILGESLAMGVNPPAYTNDRIKKYGRLFKSNLFAQPAVVGTTPEFARLVIGNSSLFASGWPDNVSAVVGKKAFMFRDGPEHINLKKILIKTLLPESLKTQVSSFEAIILKHLNIWADKGNYIANKGAKEVTLELGMYMVLGIKDIGATPEGRMALGKFELIGKSMCSPPVNFPGFTYYKALKAKNWLAAYFMRLYLERKGKPNQEMDMLGVLLAHKENPQAKAEVQALDDDDIADNLVLLWFGSYDTTSTTLIWVLKFLNDHPDVYKKVKTEQDDIIKQKLAAEEDPSRLTWEDVRKMTYSTKFFQEVQRIVSITGILFRKSVQDVEFEGKLIPKDWAVALMLASIHQDPEIYPDPFKFDPSRFDTTPKPYTYMPFSSGPHMCPGGEMAKMLTLIFIHHLVTGYEFEGTAPDQGIIFDSFPNPKGGYPIKLQRKNNVY